MADIIPTTQEIRESFAMWQINTDADIGQLSALEARERTEMYRRRFDKWAQEHGVPVEIVVLVEPAEVRGE